ncbi:hypothetical protein [Rummeliibacillus sp. SL167]|uniref:hypothetical protein n=1 Tax=Rummeliibacillus sp. SL167 TaxID=2579792 RepID=UPI0011B7337B|nr:hypothetical protein [Rummeliibacillus sp. SL167]
MKIQDLALMQVLLNNRTSKTDKLSSLAQLSKYNSISSNTLKRLGQLDTIEISAASKKQLAAKQAVTSKLNVVGNQAIQSLKSIDGKEIKELRAVNNVLEIKAGNYYRVSSNGTSTILTNFGGSHVGVAYGEIGNAIGVGSSQVYTDNSGAERLATFFDDLTSTAGYFASNFSKEENLQLLGSVGIQPGWFTVKTDERTFTHYLREDGAIYPQYQVQGQRDAFMKENLFDIGYKPGEKITFNKVEYVVDETGHINLPKDAPVFFDTNDVDPVYRKRQQHATIKEQLNLMGGIGQVLTTSKYEFSLDKDGNVVEKEL